MSFSWCPGKENEIGLDEHVSCLFPGKSTWWSRDQELVPSLLGPEFPVGEVRSQKLQGQKNKNNHLKGNGGSGDARGEGCARLGLEI